MPRDPDKLDLIPYDVARRAWEALPQEDRLSDTPPPPRWLADGDNLRCRACQRERAHCRCCPTCGYPQGERGFIRLPFPRHHEFFGRAICCGDCWPWPFGHGSDGKLSSRAHEIAALWDKEEHSRQRAAVGR